MEEKEIVWRKVALLQVEQVFLFLLENASEQSAHKFLDSIEKCTKIIATHPTVGMPSQKKVGVRSYQVVGNRRLYYAEQKDKIYILSLFDLRQDPQKNKY